MIISVDFDNTVCEEQYPLIGELLPNVKEVINYIFDRGHEIIINTCRNDIALREAIGFLKYNEIKYDYVNKNSPRAIKRWGSDTKKISCDLSIDDKSLFIQYNWYLQGKEFSQSILWRDVDRIMYEMEKPLVICIVGESGVGKSMVADYFQYEYNVNLIQSYTDRPKRFHNEGGHTFVSPVRMDAILQEEVLAETTFGSARYCCLRSDIVDSNVYVLDERGLQMLKQNWEHELDIYSIRIHRQEDKRLESVGEERIKRDEGKFTLNDEYYDYVIQNVNDDQEDVFASVKEFVKQFRFEKRFLPYEIMIEDDDL